MECATSIVNEMSCPNSDIGKKMSQSYDRFFENFAFGTISTILPKEFRKTKAKYINTHMNSFNKILTGPKFPTCFKPVNDYIKDKLQENVRKRFKNLPSTNKEDTVYFGVIVPALEECAEIFTTLKDKFEVEADDYQIDAFIDAFNSDESTFLRNVLCDNADRAVEQIKSLNRDILTGLDRWMTTPFYVEESEDVSIICKSKTSLTESGEQTVNGDKIKKRNLFSRIFNKKYKVVEDF